MILPIIKIPDQILRKKSIEVKYIDKKIKKLCKDMVKTMNANNGAGLAAPQVGESLRIIVFKKTNGHKDVVMINPIIKSHSKEINFADEGCLSIQNGKIYHDIPRYNSIVVEYTSVKGKQVNVKLSGMDARVVQHEIDHLNGKLIIDFFKNVSNYYASLTCDSIHL